MIVSYAFFCLPLMKKNQTPTSRAANIGIDRPKSVYAFCRLDLPRHFARPRATKPGVLRESLRPILRLALCFLRRTRRILRALRYLETRCLILRNAMF